MKQKNVYVKLNAKFQSVFIIDDTLSIILIKLDVVKIIANANFTRRDINKFINDIGPY